MKTSHLIPPNQLTIFDCLQDQNVDVADNSVNHDNTTATTTNETSLNSSDGTSSCTVPPIDNYCNNTSVTENYSNNTFSFFNAPIKNTKPCAQYGLKGIYEYITSNEKAIKTTEEYRKLIENGVSDDSKKYKSTNFDYCTFSGVFESRREKDLIKHSGLLCLDFDHVLNFELLRSQLPHDEHFDTALLFRSPSGDGLKWVIRIDDLDKNNHLIYFTSISNYIESVYGIKADASGKDVCRACFLPHDPDCYYCENPKTPTKKFIPEDWLLGKVGNSIFGNVDATTDTLTKKQVSSSNDNGDIETVVSRIEALKIDIAPSYQEWCNLGFALSDELGENGRSIFHRISRFYTNYRKEEADKQFTFCLNSKGSGITIKTFFDLAQKAGVNIRTSSKSYKSSSNVYDNNQIIKTILESISHTNIIDVKNMLLNNNIDVVSDKEETDSKPLYSEDVEDVEETPTFSQDLKALPAVLKQISDVALSAEDADMLLLGSITVLSGCMPNIRGYYSKVLFPNLFLFVTAPAGSGKGRLELCRILAKPIHEEILKQSQKDQKKYESNLREYNSKKKKDSVEEAPKMPPHKTLIIPGNITAAAFHTMLYENDGVGIIFETEVETLSSALLSKFGHFIDVFLKAFHHETISYARKKDFEHAEIQNPRLSVILSGTPKYVSKLIPDTENGLFSRFIFCSLGASNEWRSPFDNKTNVSEIFEELGNKILEMYHKLEKSEEIIFSLTKEQESQFNTFFEKEKSECADKYGEDIIASINRLGIIAFRIAMVFTTLRVSENGDFSKELYCSDEDFNNAMIIAKVILKHDIKIYKQMYATRYKPLDGLNEQQSMLYESLPNEFDWKTFLENACKLGINKKTAERYKIKLMEKGYIRSPKHNCYIKLK